MEYTLAQHTGLIGCECPACSSGPEPIPTDSIADYLGASVDGLAGITAPNGKPIWSVDAIAAHLNRSGASFVDGPDPAPQQGDEDPTTITYGFFESQLDLALNGYALIFNGQPVALSQYFNFASFNEAQRAAAREAVQSWDDVAAITFVETDADNADINFGNLANAPTTQAFAYLPFGRVSSNPSVNAQIQEIAGDVWVSASQITNFWLDEGGYGLQTLTHEVGHSLGLSHPGGYNADGSTVFSYSNYAEYYQDTRAYTVMSYFNASSIGANHFDFHMSTNAYSGVPLIHDIAAIQAMYGADMTTRTGDTVYGFNSNAGRDSFDFDLTPAPVMAIWDAGGIDTIDASGYATNQIIDLNDGALSSIGGVTFETAPSFEEVNANRTAQGLPPVSQATYDANMAFLEANPWAGALTDNVGIAYGAIIENAIGGSGHDLLIGNEVMNRMIGNAGDDTFVGGDGVDFFTGGAGADTFYAEINPTTVASKMGAISIDIVTDFRTGVDMIDLGLIDADTTIDGQQGFVMVEEPTGVAGELYSIVYGNMLAVSRSLGLDLSAYEGSLKGSGQVTVVFGDVDGGGADFAFILVGSKTIDASDFINLGGMDDVDASLTVGTSANAVADAGKGAAADFGTVDAGAFHAANDTAGFEFAGAMRFDEHLDTINMALVA